MVRTSCWLFHAAYAELSCHSRHCCYGVGGANMQPNHTCLKSPLKRSMRVSSFSTARTRACFASRWRVRLPVPGPTSITASPAATRAAVTMLARIWSSVQKFWPSDLQVVENASVMDGSRQARSGWAVQDCLRRQQQHYQQQPATAAAAAEKCKNARLAPQAAPTRFKCYPDNIRDDLRAYFLALMFAAFKVRAVVCDLALVGSHIQPTCGTSNSLSMVGPSERLL